MIHVSHKSALRRACRILLMGIPSAGMGVSRLGSFAYSNTIELVFNNGPGAGKSLGQDSRALGPLLNTNSIVPVSRLG